MADTNNGKSPENTPPSAKRYLMWIMVVLGITLLLPALLKQIGNSVQEISWIEFEEKILNKNAVEKLVVVNQDHAEIYLKKEFKNDTSFAKVFKPLIGKEPNPGPHYMITMGVGGSL